VKYFFITNYGQIYYRVLPLLENENPEDVVIVAFSPMSDYFKMYTKFKVIELKSDPVLLSRSITKTLLNLHKNNTEFSKLLSDITDSEIYFFGNSWKLGIFRHIQKISFFYRCNKIIYYPSDQSPTNYSYSKTFKSKLICHFINVLTGLSVNIVNDSGVVSFELGSSFFSKNEIITHRVRTEPTHKFDIELPVMHGKDILFVSEDLNMYVDGIVKKADILNKITKIITNERSVLKRHPTQIESSSSMYGIELLPSEVPSELFMSHPWKYVIGIESLSIIKATQLTNATCISILELFEYKDPQRKKDLIEWQIRESNGKILFPKTLSEFQGLIS
jgi:hypothetical protein